MMPIDISKLPKIPIMRLGSRRIALVALICAGIAAAWLADSAWLADALWQKYDQAREFAALTPRQHYDRAMVLRHRNLKEAVRHLEAIPADSPAAYMAARQPLRLLRLQLERPREYQAMRLAARTQYEWCKALLQAEALAEVEKQGIPCPNKTPTGKCYVSICGNYIEERCSVLSF